MKPFVGLPSAPGLTGCAYGLDIDSDTCGKPVTVHITGRAEGWGWIRLVSCDAHRSIAEASCVEVADVHAAKDCTCEAKS